MHATLQVYIAIQTWLQQLVAQIAMKLQREQQIVFDLQA